MKNLLFTIFAFGSLVASGMAGPIVDGGLGLEARELKAYTEHERSVQGLEARGNTDYADHRRYVQELLSSVKELTAQMNRSADAYASTSNSEEKKNAIKQVDTAARGVVSLLDKARTSKVNTRKRESSSENYCDDLCIFGYVRLLVYEIFGTVSYAVLKLGIEPAIEYMLQMIFCLVRLLTYWNIHIIGLFFAIQETVNGLFVAIGVDMIGVVHAGSSTG